MYRRESVGTACSLLRTAVVIAAAAVIALVQPLDLFRLPGRAGDLHYPGLDD